LTLQEQVEALQESSAVAQARAKRLKDRTIEDMGALTLSMGGGGSAGSISLDELMSKVALVYVRCGFDADKSVGTLQVHSIL
jgi:uridine phosphorylase